MDLLLTIFSTLNPYGELIDLFFTSPSFTFYPFFPKDSPDVFQILFDCSLAISNVMKDATPLSVVRYIKEKEIFFM
jgi:hypothetical protein